MQKQRQKYSRQKGMKAKGGSNDYENEKKQEKETLVPNLGVLL